MYLPKHFQVDDLQILAQLITEYPLATLVGNLDGHLEVNHLPLMLTKDGKKFYGHIARTNPLVKVAEQENREVTAVFHGPNAYITPAWYPSKKETGKVVPTWNYAVVHAEGKLSLIDNPHWIRQHVSQMTDTHEPTYLVGKFKLSQNRSPSEYTGVVENLQKSPEENLRAMLALMKRPQ